MSGRRGNSADLREALLALVRTTLDQVGAVRDAALRQAQTQRTFLDQALLSRKRKDALAALGEELYARLLAGELTELAQSPTIAGMLEELVELDDAIAAAEAPASEAPADWDKSRARHGRPSGGARVWRPGAGAGIDAGDGDTEDADAEARPKRRRQRAAPGQRRGGIAFVSDDEPEDDDLSAFMHDDDVPEDPAP